MNLTGLSGRTLGFSCWQCSFLRGPVIESRTGDRIFSRFHTVTPGNFGGKYLKIGHGRFLLHVSQFSIYYDRTIRYCITCAVDKALLNNKQKSIVRCLQSVTPSAAVHLAPHKRDAL
jgi:hypothetical protein